MNSLEQLTKEVKEAVTQDPASSVQILQACQEGLLAYAEYQKNRREALASNVVSLLLMKNKPNTLPWMIDIAYFQFPNGCDSHCQSGIKWWANFIEVCKKSEIDMDWIFNVKGYGEWWKNIVEPCL
jgi:hypothetical protein